MKVIVPLSLPTSELLESITLPLPTTRKKSIIITKVIVPISKKPISKKPISVSKIPSVSAVKHAINVVKSTSIRRNTSVSDRNKLRKVYQQPI
jgi:hypothetical protein